MDRSIARLRARVVVLAGALIAALVVVPSAHATTLNPPPPAFETCHGSGTQTICEGKRTLQGGLEPTGIWCGSAPDAFEIIDDGGTVREHFTRWYDANGMLVRRLAKETWLNSAWTNPLAGTAVAYRQSNVIEDILATPGDLGSATETSTGVVNFTVPGQGAIVRNAGRTVLGADGTLEFRSGPQAFLDYFLEGDTSALQPICDALAG